LLPGAPDEPELPIFLANRRWVDFRHGFTDEGLRKLIQEIKEVSDERSRDSMKWQEAAELLERKRKDGKRWTSYEKMAQLLASETGRTCSPATFHKAVDRTPALKEWATGPESSALRMPSIDDPDNPAWTMPRRHVKRTRQISWNPTMRTRRFDT